MNIPLPEQVRRFRADLEALAGAAPGRMGIALSGGPDSLALLLLAQAAFPGSVEAATVDHRLRAESAAEAGFAAGICAMHGIPHAILAAAAPPGGNVQSSARALRYRLLADWARGRHIGLVLTAHHADDQAETLLMRLNRGAGLAGLAGIRPRVDIDGLDVARPLLGWARAELAGIVAAAGIDPVDDPSNRDERYDRARLRARIADADWLEAPAFAQTAAALAEAETALDWATDMLIAQRIDAVPGGVALDPQDVPAELRRRLLLRVLAMLAPDADPPRGDAVQRALAALEAGAVATLAGIKCLPGPVWRFERAPPRRG